MVSSDVSSCALRAVIEAGSSRPTAGELGALGNQRLKKAATKCECGDGSSHPVQCLQYIQRRGCRTENWRRPREQKGSNGKNGAKQQGSRDGDVNVTIT